MIRERISFVQDDVPFLKTGILSKGRGPACGAKDPVA
jgi:hypothetical protein